VGHSQLSAGGDVHLAKQEIAAGGMEFNSQLAWQQSIAMPVADGSFGPDRYPHVILAILLASAITASTESVIRQLWNNAKDGLCLCDIAAVRRQSGITAVRAVKCIVEFLHASLR
jgi:hypothetical protein